MKRILLSLVLVGGVAGAAYMGATTAFFSDTETSTANSFEAGTVDLQLGANYSTAANGSASFALGELDGQALFDLTDLKPGDEGSVDFQLLVDDNDSWVCSAANVTSTDENTLTEPEDEAGDSPGPEGELQNYLSVQVVVDGSVIAGPVLLSDYSTDGWQALNDSVTQLLESGPVLGGQQYDMTLQYCFGTFDGTTCNGAVDANMAQSDIVTGDLQFYAVQARNNGDFVCDSLNQEEIESEVGTSWSPHDNSQDFFAKARANNTNNFELALGTDAGSPAGQTTEEATWVDGQAYLFTLSYDGVGTATFEMNGEVLNFAVTDPVANRIGINAKANNPGATTTVSNVQLDGTSPSTDTVSATETHNHLLLTGSDLTDGFTLTGEMTVTWGDYSNPDESEAMQIIVD